MHLIIDTNILLAALIKDSTVREIILMPFFEFSLPEFAIVELKKHLSLISQRSSLTKNEIDILLGILLENITIVSKSQIAPYIPKAKEAIGRVDMNDVPFVALAYAIENDGIWTQDKDFDVLKDIKVWKTKDILRYLRENLK